MVGLQVLLLAQQLVLMAGVETPGRLSALMGTVACGMAAVLELWETPVGAAISLGAPSELPCRLLLLLDQLLIMMG